MSYLINALQIFLDIVSLGLTRQHREIKKLQEELKEQTEKNKNLIMEIKEKNESLYSTIDKY